MINNIAISSKYRTLWVKPHELPQNAPRPPPRPPPKPPIRLLTSVFFTWSLEEHTWQLIALWLVKKNSFRYWSLLPQFGTNDQLFPQNYYMLCSHILPLWTSCRWTHSSRGLEQPCLHTGHLKTWFRILKTLNANYPPPDISNNVTVSIQQQTSNHYLAKQMR